MYPWEEIEGNTFLNVLGWSHVIASISPWLGSVTYHLFMNHRKGARLYHLLLQLDMFGIWVTECFGKSVIKKKEFIYYYIVEWLAIPLRVASNNNKSPLAGPLQYICDINRLAKTVSQSVKSPHKHCQLVVCHTYNNKRNQNRWAIIILRWMNIRIYFYCILYPEGWAHLEQNAPHICLSF